MDIRCERCATEYELEDAQIPDVGVTIKCSTCGHVFKVTRPAAAGLSLRLLRGGAPTLASCPDGATLQRWIIEQRVLRDDEISSGGQPWRKVGDVPEFAPFFALLSMPPPAARPSTLPGIAPLGTPPPQWTPPGLSGGTPAPGWTPPAPAGGTPAPGWNPVTASGTALRAAPEAEMDDTARTVQITVTPDMFGGPRPGSAPPPPPAAPQNGVGAGTQAAMPHLSSFFSPAPAAAAPSSGLTGMAWPTLGTPGDAGGTPPPHQPAATVAMAPAQVAQYGGHTPTPAATPAARPPTAPPRSPPARPAPARKPAPDHDAEIAALTKKSGGGLRMAIGAVVVIAGLAGVAYFALQEGKQAPSLKAKAAYEKARAIYLADNVAKFPTAESTFKTAVIDMGKGGFAEAEGSLAELHAAWAEQILERNNALDAQVRALAAAGKPDEAKVVRNALHDTNTEFKDKMGELLTELNGLRTEGEEHLQADRAFLDFCRLQGDKEKGAEVVAALQSKTDPETQAHVAAWLALDPAKVPAAEATLATVIQKMPTFVRARLFLAEIHGRAGDLAAETADMEGLLKVSPDHSVAKAFLDAHKPVAPPTATAEAKPEGNLPRKDEPAPKAEEPKDKGRKAEPAEEPAPKAGAAIDVDKSIDQAGKFLDKKKPAKALEIYEKVLAVKPNLSDALYGRGLALFDLGKNSEAIDAFHKTLVVNPRFGDAMIGIAEAYKKQKQNKDAVRFYQQYLDMYPTGEQAAVAKANVNALH